MGVNYYVLGKVCRYCKSKREPDIHLGKSSSGWKFTFQCNGRYYKNIDEMRKWLKGKKIRDDSGKEISYKEFWNMVDKKQKDRTNLSHAEYCRKHYPDIKDCYIEIDGYSFVNSDFS